MKKLIQSLSAFIMLLIYPVCSFSNTLIEDTSAVSAISYNMINPHIDFNRVSSYTLGWSPNVNYQEHSIKFLGAYSFGLNKLLGEIEFNYHILKSGNLNISCNTSLFSKIPTLSLNEKNPRIVNSLMAVTLGWDYYDYYESNGLSVSLFGSYKNIEVKWIVQYSSQYSLSNKTKGSLFFNTDSRDNRKISDGSYGELRMNILVNNIKILSNTILKNTKLNINGFYGRKLDYQRNSNSSFGGAEAKLSTDLSTYRKGDVHLKLNILLHGGIGTADLPDQYKYKMPTHHYFSGSHASFISAPESKYGGRKFFILHASYNLTDYLWKLAGLPVYKGNGPELVISATTGKYVNNDNIYKSTSGSFYNEMGVGFINIPIPGLRKGFCGVEGMWGIGPEAAGNFGLKLSLKVEDF
ncbi:hypothetical protein ACFLSQ_03245 [Bacteroidota bacterium]